MQRYFVEQRTALMSFRSTVNVARKYKLNTNSYWAHKRTRSWFSKLFVEFRIRLFRSLELGFAWQNMWIRVCRFGILGRQIDITLILILIFERLHLKKYHLTVFSRCDFSVEQQLGISSLAHTLDVACKKQTSKIWEEWQPILKIGKMIYSQD